MSKPPLESTHGPWRARIRWAWIGIGLASTALALFVVTWILLDRAAESRLEKAIAEADRTDPRCRLADVAADRARVPDADNSALRVKRVLERLDPRWKLADGLVIYSVGADQTDNGGRFEPRGRDDPGFDLGYRLWNENARARPAER